MYFEIVLYNSNCTFSNASGVQFTRSETSNTFSLSFAIKTEGYLLIVSNTAIFAAPPNVSEKYESVW